jgi:hypothetical protein
MNANNNLNPAVNPNCRINSRFTVGNWVMVVIGTIFCILGIIASVLPNSGGS